MQSTGSIGINISKKDYLLMYAGVAPRAPCCQSPTRQNPQILIGMPKGILQKVGTQA